MYVWLHLPPSPQTPDIYTHEQGLVYKALGKGTKSSNAAQDRKTGKSVRHKTGRSLCHVTGTVICQICVTGQSSSLENED